METAEEQQSPDELLFRMFKYRDSDNWLGFWQMVDELIKKNNQPAVTAGLTGMDKLSTITAKDLEATKRYIEKDLENDRAKIIEIKKIAQKLGITL